MHTITVRNVNYALPEGIQLIRQYGQPVSPRGQKTLEVQEPVATVYACPQERVLFSTVRDANPFLHLFEALYLLGGRDDVAFLAQFVPRMVEFSDDGHSYHGSYGRRLRSQFGIDQLDEAIKKLRREPNTRQAVLQIWNAQDDLASMSKDIPCNDLIFLKLRDGALRMTVCCRSNDLVWGCYGANAVQFSMLGEYLAACIGCRLGSYTQVSDSFHAYTEREDWARVKDLPRFGEDPYSAGLVCPYPLVDVPDQFDADLTRWLNDPGAELGIMFPKNAPPLNSFFWRVATPLYRAWVAHKKDKTGLITLQEELHHEGIPHERPIDWHEAATEWLARREAHAESPGSAPARTGAARRGGVDRRPSQVRR